MWREGVGKALTIIKAVRERVAESNIMCDGDPMKRSKRYRDQDEELPQNMRGKS
jgi:hypothetical protein